MAAPPPSPERAGHTACLSLLLFHLHAAVGAAAPDPAAALAELLAAIPALAPKDQQAIAGTFAALRAPSDAPGHPGLVPLVPAEPHSLPLVCSPPLEASVSPFLLHDTLVFDLSFVLRFAASGLLQALTSKPFSLLRQASLSLEPSFAPSLGLCCILYLQTHDSSLAFAQACAEAIGPRDLRLCGESTLLGRPIREFSASGHTWHIWLDDPHHPIQEEEDGSYQQHLLNLLCCRAKMAFAARAGRCAFEAGLSHYQAFEAGAAQLATLETDTAPTQATHTTEDAQQLHRIANLEGLLTALPQHGLGLARCERDITTHRLTVSSNAFNGAQSARALWREGDTFLKRFLEQDGPTWLQQLDHDGEVLRSGQRYSEQLIDTLRAIVALDGQKLQLKLEREENQRDRGLQRTIFFTGAALSISGLAAATRPRPTAKLLAVLHRHDPPAAWLWLGDITIHALIGLAAALVALLLWWAGGRWRAGAAGKTRRLTPPARSNTPTPARPDRR
jgi:hypothetical protein